MKCVKVPCEIRKKLQKNNNTNATLVSQSQTNNLLSSESDSECEIESNEEDNLFVSHSDPRVEKTNSASTSSAMSNFMDKMTEKDQEQLEKLLARAIYESGAPLHIMERKEWKDFFPEN